MQVINSELIKDKKVLLRYDIDVALGKGTGDPSTSLRTGRLQVTADFRLKAGLPTLKLCLDQAAKVIVIGHIGRPEGKVVEKLRVKPVAEWFTKQDNLRSHIGSGKLVVLENLRFDVREEGLDAEFAREIAAMGDVYVNEAFAAFRPAVSTTILPTLLPHAAGLRFAQEVRMLREVRNNPQKPFVVIMGGAKVEDKLPVIKVLAQKADAVLVGGKIARELTKHEGDPSSSFDKLRTPQDDNLRLDSVRKLSNVLIGKLNQQGTDIATETTDSWKDLIMKAKMIVWNGPVGKFEDPKNDQSAKLAQAVLQSGAEIVVGGGDTISLLGGLGLLGRYEEKGFVSTGGGAMLKFLTDGSLPTIDALS